MQYRLTQIPLVLRDTRESTTTFKPALIRPFSCLPGLDLFGLVATEDVQTID